MILKRLTAAVVSLLLCGAAVIGTQAAELQQEETAATDNQYITEAIDITEEAAAVKGDLNGDGKVTIADAVLLKKYLAKLTTLTTAQKTAADYNSDSKVTVADATAIQKYVAGTTPPVTTGPKIYLSPSNQYGNLYATGSTNEMVQCNKIADALKNILTAKGYQVKKAPQGQAMNTSIAESNNYNPDLHLCIHTNAFNGSYTGGTLVMIYSMETANAAAGNAILSAVAPITLGSDYALQARPELSELDQTNALAVYCEVEFHDTVTGSNWIINHTNDIAQAIAKGICNYFNYGN